MDIINSEDWVRENVSLTQDGVQYIEASKVADLIKSLPGTVLEGIIKRMENMRKVVRGSGASEYRAQGINDAIIIAATERKKYGK